MEKENKKKLKRYNVLLVPGDGDRVRQFHASGDFLFFIVVFVMALFITAISYIVYSAGKVDEYRAKVGNMQNIIQALSDNNIVLQADNETLQAQLREANVTIETKNSAEKQQNEKESLEYIPSGLPLDGQVGVPSTYSKDKQYITFNTGTGSKVIATGAGTVSYVGESAEYGYVVKIDHGNGYISAYYDHAVPTVSEKDTVIRGSTLFVVDSDNDVLTYQISYEDQLIDPATVMDIDG